MLNQIWSDATYVYVATTSGLDIIEVESESIYAYITISGGFETVWANNTRVYLGTTSGIDYVNKSCIVPGDIAVCLTDYSVSLTSSGIVYLHGDDNHLLCCTVSGVDVIKEEPSGYRYYTTITGASKCFMTPTKKMYYTMDTPDWAVHRRDVVTENWIVPDRAYTFDGTTFPADLEINDIFVTEATSSGGLDNTLFIATTSGVYVLDEETQQYDLYYTG